METNPLKKSSRRIKKNEKKSGIGVEAGDEVFFGPEIRQDPVFCEKSECPGPLPIPEYGYFGSNQRVEDSVIT